MVSDAIRKQVNDIQEQNFKRLQELSIIVLLLQIPLLLDGWYGDLVDARLSLPIFNGIIWLLYCQVGMLIMSFACLITIISFFWRLRNEPKFHVLFIERKEERKQMDTKQFLTLFLIPVGISIGLAFSNLIYNIFYMFSHFVIWSYEHTIWWHFEHSLSIYFPFIIAASIGVPLYVIYHNKQWRAQENLIFLLFISIILSTSVLIEIYYNFLKYWQLTSLFGGNIAQQHPPGSLEFTITFLIYGYHALFLTSLILLLYLTYRINSEHRKFYTLEKGRHLRGVIEEGVGILPKRVRAGDSHSVFLDLTLSKDFVSTDHLCKSSDYLEAELQAVGLKVAGETRVRICETSPLLITRWNCGFPNSGRHTMDLMVNVVKRDNSRHLIFTQNHTVKVDSLLSTSWAPIIVFITPILATVVQVMLHL